jgi:hypothetical protein
VNIDERWAWVPGDRAEHPVYAPALVAFVEDPGAGQGGEAPIGWFPLAPGEAYIPWYPAGPEYIERVNVAYAARYRDPGWRDRAERAGALRQAEFANRRFATVVHRDAMAYGRPVIQEMVHMPAERLEHAAVVSGAPRVMPAAARIVAGPGGLHGDVPHSIPAVAGPGGLRAPSPEHLAPSGAPARPEARPLARPPEPAAQHVPQQFRPRMAAPSQQYVRPEVPHTPASARQEMARQFGRPEVFHTPAPTYRPGAQQFGRPEVAAMPRPGAPQVMRPGAPQVMRPGAPQFGARPAVPARAPAVTAAPQKKK